MRIEAVEPIAIATPFREPYVSAKGTLEARESVLLRLRGSTADGLGEGVPLTLRGGESTAAVLADIQDLCVERLRSLELPNPATGGFGAVRDAIFAVVEACREDGASAPTLAAVDTALHDLAARAAGVPLHRLLGAERYEPVACNATLSAGPPDAVASRAEAWRDRGFSSFKLKVGGADDADVLAAVREAVGPSSRIRIDANGSWGVERSRVTLAALQPLGLELVEQPVLTLEEMASLRALTPVPLAADESVADAADARSAGALGACDLATVKLSKVGGIGAALEIAAILPIYLSSALDGPVGIATAAHLAQVLPRGGAWEGTAHGLATLELFAANPASVGPFLEGPDLRVPAGPGHGVELDPAALAELEIDV